MPTFDREPDGSVRKQRIKLVTTDGEKLFQSQGLSNEKGITLIEPVNGDSISIWVPPSPIIITAISAHRQGGTSIIFNIEHGTDPSNPGTSLWSGNQTVTANTSIDQTFDAFNDATVLADNIIKLEIITVTGSVTEFHVTIEYKVD